VLNLQQQFLKEITMSSLAESVRVFQGRDLTVEEKDSLIKFQEIYEISDDDPLVAVLAMIGAHKILMESAPGLIFQKAIETIELHQQTLQEQSTLIAKELIAALSHNIIMAAKERVSRKNQLTKHVLIFFAGGLTGLGAVLLGYV
jgi:hypothetical protein